MDAKSFLGGVCAGGVLTALLASIVQNMRKDRAADFLEATMRGYINVEPEVPASEDSNIISEQFVRNEQFFGDAGQSLIRNSRVVVVGVGGVGSHCAVSLARSGVGNIRLIDFDRVTVSSLNRHASARRSEVGFTKVASLKNFIHSFAPECEVDAVEALFNYESAAELISDFKPDWVVDAIDNLATKADLLAYCYENKIKVICACGSAAKCDPTRLRISTVENSSEDPLARAIRQRLRLNRGLSNTGIPVVYSTERTTRGLLPLKDFQEDNPKEFQTLDKFRVRVLPVIAPLPTIMGNAIASYVLCQLAEQPFTPLTTAPVASNSHRKKLWNFVRRTFPECGPRLADSDDADLILDSVFDACSGRSVISGDSGNICMVPWESSGSSFSALSLVLMTSTEAKTHLTEPYKATKRLEQAQVRIRSELVSVVSDE